MTGKGSWLPGISDNVFLTETASKMYYLFLAFFIDRTNVDKQGPAASRQIGEANLILSPAKPGRRTNIANAKFGPVV